MNSATVTAGLLGSDWSMLDLTAAKIQGLPLKLPGLKAVAPGRSVVLDVPATTTIDDGGGGMPIPVPLDYGAKGDPVVAWSTIAAPGLRSELAQPGTIAADRLLYNDAATR